MRCPKCGFISFDHLTSCAKCGKDIAEVASELQGTSIKVETPMFLSGALAAYAERQEPFAGHGEFEPGEGIDFSMEEENTAGEPIEMAAEEEGVDISFEDKAEKAEISMAVEGSEEAAAEEAAVDFTIEPEAEAEVEVEAEAESFEELDFLGTVDDEEGGLEFDLEDFIEDDGEDK